MEHASAALLRRLNPFCARALEAAASLCQIRAHAEILPEHWLLKLLEQGEGDITVIARRYEWDMDDVWQDLLSFLNDRPRQVCGRPASASRAAEHAAGSLRTGAADAGDGAQSHPPDAACLSTR